MGFGLHGNAAFQLIITKQYRLAQCDSFLISHCYRIKAE